MVNEFDLVEHSRLPRNAEPPIARLTAAFLTPQADLYIRNHGAVPQIDAADYRLTVDGMVADPLHLSLNDIQARFAERTVTAALQCAGNRRSDMGTVAPVQGDPWAPGAIGNAEWTGVSLADVLRAAGVNEAEGRHVVLAAYDALMEADGSAYCVSIPLAKAMTPDVLLAYAINGEALTPDHGFPLRVIVPGFAGARGPKWLASVTVQAHEADSPTQKDDYRLHAADGRGGDASAAINEMPVNSAICEPRAGAQLQAGSHTLRGYAIATEHGVERVEVSADGGASWHRAAIDQGADNRWAWVLWNATLLLGPGSHRLRVRAFDKAGATQPEAMEECWNPRGYLATAWHCVDVEVA